MGSRSAGSTEPTEGYELIDVGGGRRLERFGDRTVDRPSPAATGPRSLPSAWDAADLVFEGSAPSVTSGAPASSPRRGGWRARRGDLRPWAVHLAGLTFELRPTAAGQVGIFPEQLEMLGWLEARLASRAATPSLEPVSPVAVAAHPPRATVLNLFAFTGAATLAAARVGAAAVHVDASRPAVAWARRNAELSGLADGPIRWLVDDARAFVARERRRQRRYQGLILDPPTYGHGDGGREWRLDRDLPALLGDCAAILDAAASFVLLTAHTPGYGPAELAELLRTAIGREVERGWLQVASRRGTPLRLGAYARTSSA